MLNIQFWLPHPSSSSSSSSSSATNLSGTKKREKRAVEIEMAAKVIGGQASFLAWHAKRDIWLWSLISYQVAVLKCRVNTVILLLQLPPPTYAYGLSTGWRDGMVVYLLPPPLFSVAERTEEEGWLLALPSLCTARPRPPPTAAEERENSRLHSMGHKWASNRTGEGEGEAKRRRRGERKRPDSNKGGIEDESK